MDEDEARQLKLLNWSMPLYIVVFGVLWGVIGGNSPPMPASTSAAELAAFFRAHAGSLKITYAVCLVASTLWVTWSMALFGVMERIEAPRKTWSYLQVLGGSLTGVVIMLATVFWYAAAFRPETDPAIIQALNDLAWLAIDGAFGVTTLHFIACAMVFLGDKRPKPLMPRAVSWLGVFVALDFLTELAMPYFRSGPLSWSGFVNYWMPFELGFIWLLLTTFFLFRAIDRLVEEQRVR